MLPNEKRLDGRISFWLRDFQTHALLSYQVRDQNNAGWYHSYDLCVDHERIFTIRAYDNGALDAVSLTYYVGICLDADATWDWDSMILMLVNDWLERD